MIRPLTALSLIMAASAGLYLYQVKHRTLLLDREIAATMHETEALHAKVGLLQAEWALLNQPDRLADLATRHLALKPLAPTQFVPMAELERHLPPVVATSAAPETTDGDDDMPPTAKATGDAPIPEASVPEASLSEASVAQSGAVATKQAGTNPPVANTTIGNPTTGNPTVASPAGASPAGASPAGASASGASAAAARPPAIAALVSPLVPAHPAPAHPAPAHPQGARKAPPAPARVAANAAAPRPTPPAIAPQPVAVSVLRPIAIDALSPPSRARQPATIAATPAFSAAPVSSSVLGGRHASLPPPVPMSQNAASQP